MTFEEEVQARKIAKMIEADIPENFRLDWASVSAWLWLSDTDKGCGGGAYVFDRLGYATGFSFPLQAVLTPLSTLRLMHPEQESHPWKTVLLQFGRAEPDLRLSYEYNDPYRWMVTEENYKTKIRELKPDFSDMRRLHKRGSRAVWSRNGS